VSQTPANPRQSPARAVRAPRAGVAPRAVAANRGATKSAVLSTKERLILEAERLFAERGIDGVTMRMICEAADQKFAGSVQYHFGDLAGLLYAVFEYREEQLQPQREVLLEQARREGLLGDVRHLLRVIFEPNFRMYADLGQIAYIRCHSAYLATHRPRGVDHPVDRGSPVTQAMRAAMDLLDHRLAALGDRRAGLRLEAVGAMVLFGITEYAAEPSRHGISAEAHFAELLDMAAQAIMVLPRPRETDAG
jgi:AcrR family transcriptional regulator